MEITSVVAMESYIRIQGKGVVRYTRQNEWTDALEPAGAMKLQKAGLY